MKTCELEPPPRMQTAMKLPVVVFVANAREFDVAVLASMFLCCTRAMFPAADRLVREKFACAATPDAEAVTV